MVWTAAYIVRSPINHMTLLITFILSRYHVTYWLIIDFLRGSNKTFPMSDHFRVCETPAKIGCTASGRCQIEAKTLS
jgi:hypothetical protein